MDQKEEILDKTNGGLKVFQHYLGSKVAPGVKFKNPFYTDTKASCNLYYGKKCDRYFLVDFGDSTVRGDCFWFVSRWENLDYHNDFDKILRLIDKELCLNIFNDTNPILASNKTKPSIVADNVPSSSTKMLPFEIETNASMSLVEQRYWERYGITSDTLKKFDVKSVRVFKSCRSDGTPYDIVMDGHPFFGYFFNEGEGVKIYRPGQALRFLYAGHFPHPYVFGLKQLPPTGDVLYFTGGEKDVLSLSSHGFHAISLNSETARVPEGLVSSLLKRFNDFAILYDVDETGLKEAENRVKEIQELGFSNVWQIRLPLAGTKQEKDVSDFFRLGHTSEELQGITEIAMLNKERSLCR